MFSVCIVSATAIMFVCPETKQLTLEEIGATFGDEVAAEVRESDKLPGSQVEKDGVHEVENKQTEEC